MSILRMPAIRAETGYRSHASIYTSIKNGTFTKPVLIGERSVGWPDDEVKSIVIARIAGQTDDQIRDLVDRLAMLEAISNQTPAKQAERFAQIDQAIAESEECHFLVCGDRDRAMLERMS